MTAAPVHLAGERLMLDPMGGLFWPETGLLAVEGDPESLAAHLATLLGDRALAEAMGRRGRDYVCAGFDLVRQTEKLEGIYRELLA